MLQEKPLRSFESDCQINRNGTETVYVHRIVNNFVKAVTFPPYFKKADGTVTTSDDFKILRVQKSHADILVSLLNSSLFFWYWRAHGDGFHCGFRDIGFFPLSLHEVEEGTKSELAILSKELNTSLNENSEIRTRDQKATGLIYLQTFFVGKSKRCIDKVDSVLAVHFGLSAEELDFIQNFDIKYRLGASPDDEG